MKISIAKKHTRNIDSFVGENALARLSPVQLSSVIMVVASVASRQLSHTNRSHVCNSGRKEGMLWRAAYSMQDYQWRPA